MAPKRKSDTMDGPAVTVPFAEVSQQEAARRNTNIDQRQQQQTEKPSKKARVDASYASEASGAKYKGKEATASDKPAPMSWKDVEVEVDEETGKVLVYDDCAEIRRKIRLLQKDPNFKVAPWLREIAPGGINSNSFNRFMKGKTRMDGCGNRTYYYAYIYFECVRISENKKKTKKREENETEHPDGFSTDIPRQVAYIVRRGYPFRLA